MSTETSLFLTLEAAASRIVGLSPRSLREWIRRGKLRAFKPGRRVVVREADLLALVLGSEKGGAR